MADSVIPNNPNTSLLEPFLQRASECEIRLSKLEANLQKKQGGENSELVRELQSKLDQVTTELASEQEKAAKLENESSKLATENAKKDYRIIHLLRREDEERAYALGSWRP